MSNGPAAAQRPAVYRSRYFVASLWAALVPVGLLAVGCLAVLMLPEGTNKMIETARRAAGVAMILVPFFYTGLVIVIYGIARLLHMIKLMSRITLLAAFGILSLAAAGLVAWTNRELELLAVSNVLLFAVILASGVLTLSGGALIWWRVASRLPPPSVKKERSRRRHSSRERAGESEV